MDRRSMIFGGSTAAMGLFVPTNAFACEATTCEVAAWQASRQPYTGKTAPKQVDTCVRLLSTTKYHLKTEVLLVEGDDAEYGRVITSLGRGNGHAFQFPAQPAGTEDIYVREFCFEGRLIADLPVITFCNGANRGDGNHHTLSLYDETAPYLSRLKRTGHVGDFLTLLGKERSYRPPVSTFFTAELYDKLYNGRGEWIGS